MHGEYDCVNLLRILYNSLRTVRRAKKFPAKAQRRKEELKCFPLRLCAFAGNLLFFYLENTHEHGDIRLGQLKFYVDFVCFLRDFQIIERGLGQLASLARQA